MARIAHLANFFGPRTGGLRTTMMNLGREYRALGHQAHLVVPAATDAERESDGVWIHEVAASVVPGTGGYRLILDRPRIRSILAELQPQAIELSDRTTLLHVATWGRNRAIPVTCIVHERVDGVIRAHARLAPARAIADVSNRRLARRVDRIVATTDFAAAEFTRIDVPVIRVPLGVDADFFRPDRADTTWRDQFDADVLIVMASRLSREKRPEFAIEVLRQNLAAGVDAHLLVLGDGPLMPRMRTGADGLPVTFMGFVQDRDLLATILASADVVLAPGPIETFGLAALEAMASGTPVVANISSALREVVGTEGGVCLPAHAHAWAQAAARLARDPGAGHRARHRAEEFSWTATACRMLSVSGLQPVPQAAAR